MILYLAVIFFCIQGECYFYNGKTLHNSESTCFAEIKKVDQELANQKIESRFVCLRVPVTGV